MTVKVVLKLKFRKVNKQITKAVERGLSKIGFLIERDAKIFAPRDTGFLMSSIRNDQTGLKVIIGAHAPYAEIMENPGRVRSKGKRPYMEPALKKNIPKIAGIISKEIKKVTR